MGRGEKVHEKKTGKEERWSKTETRKREEKREREREREKQSESQGPLPGFDKLRVLVC